MTGGASACTGTAYSAKLAIRHAPVAGVHHGVLHQRHADAADHAADALAAGRLRVDDPAGAVRADDPPHAGLAEIRVDGDFHEHGPKGMHGEPRGLVAGLQVDRGLDGLAEAAHGVRDVAGASACERILTRPAAGGLHGAADARHGQRAAVHRRPRQPGVAETELNPREGEAEGLGRHLRHRGVGARPHVACRDLDRGGAVRMQPDTGARGKVPDRVGG
jgi:hypothetical protein